MQTLYKEEGSQFRIELLETPKMQEFIDTHAAALDSSFQQVKMSDVMRQRLQRSNYIFSGMKTFHELNEAFPSLIDENGNRKPFEQFLNDVQKIDRTYNQNYLRAEYNFCQASADMAAKWEGFMQDGDRYNLQYRTQRDKKVRPEHAALDRVTLPMSDPFCRSITRQTDGTAAAPSCRFASQSTQRHPTTRLWHSEPKPQERTQRASSISILA